LQHSVTCLTPLRRLWANACLNSALGGTVHPSVGELNRHELHGTRKISLWKNIYLHRNLYLETQDSGCIRIGNDLVSRLPGLFWKTA
jgi:hypothetical protein